ncbi:hypothetical protein LZG04_15660 [Saccharothrix sp. S26]|uniref:Pepco domain-containing protein n=1 Tax=Saccharothrix sp. S26 TaxID=2907215 RepID=UPI001F3295F5|nr:hypothetical protein [Saccharothrix sp. S26]MCE6996222.1 hypothetical protein [Saccharothrix sp. S26]
MNAPDPAPRETIRVFGLDEAEPARTDRSTGRRQDDFRFERSEIPVEEFRRRVEDFMASMRDVISGLATTAGDYQLDQVQVTVEVSAKGKLSLLGTGGELAGKGGLTFTFKKSTE